MRAGILRFAFLVSFIFFYTPPSKAESNDSSFVFIKQTDTLFCISPENIISTAILPDSVPVKAEHLQRRKKIIAAVLAFPLPFGILGIHRIYLGTKPYMPFAYIGTLGGCFGILPLIDFITILISDDETFKRFGNNPRVFMWSR